MSTIALNEEQAGLLESSKAGPVIWDAASLVTIFHQLDTLGLVEPARTLGVPWGGQYQLTEAGRDWLASRGILVHPKEVARRGW